MSWVPMVLTRRVVLTASGVTLLTSCASAEKSGHPPDSPARAALTDAIRDRALASEKDLLARYDAALAVPSVAADSALKARLSAIRAEHASHAAALGDGDTADATPATTPATTSTLPTADPKSMVTALAKAEQDAAGARTADVLAADGATAMLLASVAASESGHAALLLGSAG